MQNRKGTFIGGLLLIVIGTSCCWVSSLLVWLGGISFLSVMIKKFNISLISAIAGFLVLLCFGLMVYRNKRKDK